MSGMEEAEDDAELTHAQPQVIRRGEPPQEVWPEHWGITLAQCKELIHECTQDPGWSKSNTVHTLVEEYVKPRTRGSGLGYALLMNQAAPLEVNVMVSHTWAENAEEFFQTLERSVRPHDVMFICALSLYQNKDGAGPTISQQLGMTASESPFRRVLDHILFKGAEAGWRWRWRSWLMFVPQIVLTQAFFLYYYTMGAAGCIPLFTEDCAVGTLRNSTEVVSMAYAGNLCMFPCWIWEYKPMDPAYMWWQYAALVSLLLAIILSFTKPRWMGAFRGRMVAVPNRQCDIYNRLWCVYEIYVATKLGVPVEMARTLAPAGKCRASDAMCSSIEDTDRIRREIEAWGRGLSGPSFEVWKNRSSKAIGAVKSFRRDRTISQTLGEENRAYRVVDRAIHLATQRARRAVAGAIVAWIVPFAMLSMAIPKGDYLTPDQFFGTVVCTGVQSVLIVGVTLALVAYYLARRSYGNVSFPGALSVAGAFVLVGVSLRVFDALCATFDQDGPTNYPPLHHCFTLYLSSAGTSLALLALCARCWGGNFVRYPWRVHVMAFLAFGVLSALVVFQAEEFTVGQVAPAYIWYASFRIMPLVGYPAFLWLAAARWGVEIGVDPGFDIRWFPVWRREATSSSYGSELSTGSEVDASSSSA